MRRLLLALTVLLAVPASAAAAPPTEIRFEGIPQFEQIRTQYAGQGVLFGRPSDFGLPEPTLGCRGPQAINAGINGASAQIACASGPVEFPDRRFAFAMEFSTERRDVRFKLSNRAANRALPATLRVYGVAGNLLESRALTLNRDATVDVVVARGTDIASIVVFGDLAGSESGNIFLDDVVALLDDVPPPRKFALALTTPSIDVIEGATADATVSVRRFNGSSGPVTVSVPELPPGISATQIEPNPVTGSSPVTLRVTASSPFVAQRQITVNASGSGGAGTGVVTTGVQTVRGLPAVTIAEGGRFTRTLAAGCGPQRFSESFNVRGDYFGNVLVGPRAAGGLIATADPTGRFASGDGTYSYDLVVDPGTSVGINTVTVRARPSGATAAELDTAFRVSPVTIAAVTPASFVRTSPGAPLRQVQVRGQFPRACAITFQDGAGQTWPVTRRDGVDVDGTNFDLWTLDVPQGAVSGPLRALSPTGAEIARSAPVDVTDLRNVFALAGLNGGEGARTNAYTWADFERTFGDDDTESCFIVCVTDDHARTYYRRWRDQVQANPGTGLCSGWVQMALRFKRGTARATDYLPTATRAWQIPSPQVDGTAIKRDIVRWQVAQFDNSFQQDRARGFARSAADERALIKQAVAGGDVYIGIRQGTAGHAVLGYDAQDITTPTGPGLTVQIYDPNIPYTTAEETSGPVRTAAVTGSTITIQGDGSWAGSGFPWAGNNGTLMATTALPADDAELPSSAGFVVSLFSSAAGGAPPAEITGIEADGRPVLGPGGEPRPGSGVTLQPTFSGAAAVPEYGLQTGRDYELTATGKGGGTYEHGLIGGGSSATVSGAPTAPGQKDTLTVRPGQAQLGFATGGAGGAVTYDLTDQNGRTTRSAQVATRARKGAGDEAELGGGTFRVRHDGPPTSMSITLRSSGEGLPGAVTTAPIRLGNGERLELRPQAWRDLQAGVRLTVRDRRGRVKRRSAARLRGTRRVALGVIRAKRSRTRVTVSGRVAKRGSAPVLFALVEQLRGDRVVARKGVTRRATQVRKGRFSLPVTVGRIRAGTRLRATVTLVDDTGDRVSVRKRIAVR